MAQYDVAIVGGGIVGLAHAWMAARRKLNVVLLERTPRAEGASVRNFGMVWPIGQPAGELHAIAMKSRGLWLELGERGVLTVEACGSIHLAHREDEIAVLQEFNDLRSHGTKMMTAAEAAEASPFANPEKLLGGMWSDTELRVDPRIASSRIAAWLSETAGVECHFSTSVVAIDDQTVRASNGRSWSAERVIVCGGSDLRTLYPGTLADSGLVPCKLQMLRSAPQNVFHPSTPHLASGLTLRHYTAFRSCPSLATLQARVKDETPELDRFGIHVMASPFSNGEVVLGDSHEYGDEITPFDSSEIDDLIMRECRKVFQLRDWRIGHRWHGIYAKHPQLPVFEAQPSPGVHLFTGTGGAGMTMSFGLADRAWTKWTGEAR